MLGANRYGKSGIRLAVVTRRDGFDDFDDLEVDVRLEGDFAAAHIEGDNRAVLPTDTMRGTCLALARDGVDPAPSFARRVASRLLDACPAAVRARVEVVRRPWSRADVHGRPHPHAFRPAGEASWVTTVLLERSGATSVSGGIRGARLLKTRGSAFSGFLRDAYTTLAETSERILATTVDAAWEADASDEQHQRLCAAVPATFAACFATHDSESVQHTLHAMGEAVLEAHPEVEAISFRLPNEHHVVADLSAYGLDNPGRVFVVLDRPYGVIEGTVVRGGGA